MCPRSLAMGMWWPRRNGALPLDLYVVGLARLRLMPSMIVPLLADMRVP